MTWLRHKATRFIDSGVQPHTPSSDARYIRFLNATFTRTLRGIPPLRLWLLQARAVANILEIR
jgi:hypothetical protein